MAKTILIKFTRPTLYRCGDLRIIGGVNEVRKEIWEAVKDNPGVKRRIENGDIVLLNYKANDKPPVGKPEMAAVVAPIQEPEKSDEPAEDYPLANLNVADATQLIKETYHYKTLKDWQERETRKRVQSTLEKQLKEFCPAEKPDKTEDDTEST
jgi:hypothetical protein